MNEATKEEIWKNVIQYISAVNDKMEYATEKEQEKLSKERYKWLNKIYNITKKKN